MMLLHFFLRYNSIVSFIAANQSWDVRLAGDASGGNT